MTEELWSTNSWQYTTYVIRYKLDVQGYCTSRLVNKCTTAITIITKYHINKKQKYNKRTIKNTKILIITDGLWL